MTKIEIINKTMDMEDLRSEEAMKIINELNELIYLMRKKDLKISSWYGSFNLSGSRKSVEWKNRGYCYRNLEGSADDKHFPWFLYWEIFWVVSNNDFQPGHRVLDLGGSSSLFSYYLASKGIDVTTIDLQKELVDNGNRVAGVMDWNLKNRLMDMRNIHLNSTFDHITSICVYEHLPVYDRVIVSEKIKNLLVKGGRFSITFDYRNPVKTARINSPEDIDEQFVKPSGLKIRGNEEFYDNGKNYLLHPFFYERGMGRYKIKIIRGLKYPISIKLTKEDLNDYTFGALFLENI